MAASIGVFGLLNRTLRQKDPTTGERQIAGVGCLSKSRTANAAEFAVLVDDEYQLRGIGTELLRRLVQIGRDEKLQQITGEILRDNYGMIRAGRNVGFEIRSRVDQGTEGTLVAYINLGGGRGHS